MTSTLEKTPSELFQWLIDVHNELGLKNFSDAESKRFGTLNVQVPAPASRVESGINKTKEFLEKFDIVVSPLSNLHSTAAIVIGVLKFVLMVSYALYSKKQVSRVMISMIRLRLGARTFASLEVR